MFLSFHFVLKQTLSCFCYYAVYPKLAGSGISNQPPSLYPISLQEPSRKEPPPRTTFVAQKGKKADQAAGAWDSEIDNKEIQEAFWSAVMSPIFG